MGLHYLCRAFQYHHMYGPFNFIERLLLTMMIRIKSSILYKQPVPVSGGYSPVQFSVAY